MKTGFILLLSLAANTYLLGQTRISGIVKDEKGEVIPGANVFIRDTYDGVSSDFEGRFSFVTTETGAHALAATFVGYKEFQKTIEISGQPIEVLIELKEEINQLEAVVISAGSFTAGEDRRRTILKPLDIATTAGATADIAGALNTLPGTTKVGESGRLFVRGGDSNEARTFIDGMVVLDAYGPSAPNAPSRGRFLPFMFKGTSFSTGGYSAEYGQALSSALVLNSKDKADFNQTDIGLLSIGADVAHTQVWDRASLSGKVQYTNLSPYFALVKQQFDWKTAPTSVEGSTAYRQQVGKDGFFKFFGNFNNSHYSIYEHAILDPNEKYLYDLNNMYAYGNGSYQQSLNTKWSVRGGLSYTLNNNNGKLDGLPLAQKESGYHAKVVFENSLSDRLEFRFGSEVIDRTFTATKQDQGAPVASLSFREPVTAVFGEAELYASKHLVTKIGARSEYNFMIEQLSVDPRFSVAYKPGGKGQFSFAYGRFRQSAKNQYLMFNNNLDPEKAEHFILNYQIITDRRTFRVETYYKNYTSLVKFENYDPTKLNNAGTGYARGVDVFWRDNQTLKNVDYWVSYSFLDTQREYLNYPIAAVPTFASKHNFSVVYKYFITPLKTQLGMAWSFASGRPYNNPNEEKFNAGKTPAYRDLSVNISYLPKPYLIVYLSCTNLFGRNNIFGYDYRLTPDADGQYAGRAVTQQAKRFLFMGVFITLTKNKSVNQLPNL